MRTVLQLLLVGLVLEWVFHLERWYIVLGLLLLMTVVASITSVQRSKRRFPGIWINTVVSIWAASWATSGFGLLIVTWGSNLWFQPQYVIPLVGMVLGNTMNGCSIGLSAFVDALIGQKDELEASLALGATRWEAARVPVRHAVRMGMIPIVNAMMIVGVVSLPGMMTGQLLAGTIPIQAVKYQIVIMFMIASATALGTVSVVLLSYLRLFSKDHQFLAKRIR